ncbi:hypothetical protein H8Z72_22455 (plasmid) [Xanthomonas citri pv. citri]|uniref:hypothetical protein n=1 Tax=Xanthomonas citri TaxID=346 RepID=UPI00193252EB|nr:hypothetical protein [Xanthomonas citri]QRD62708.1 hypothetical protein H8Z74_22625 [Xanthomonas citri pv. citri]QRD67035.1 hypothetical protein H8Z73_22710 [Xanthomonas citri pv. citri]QRD71712.1 hypothetical protein H8Z72_22455 [Xanthomonas citri pv. citri]
MSSLSGRFLPSTSAAQIRSAVAGAFGDAPFPLHEVDAHVLRARAVVVSPVFSTQDARVMDLVQARLAASLTTPMWLLHLHDHMAGPQPLAAMMLSVQLQQVHRQNHCMLVLSELKQLHSPPSLPYALRRIAARSVSEAFWSALDDVLAASIAACERQTMRRVG